MRLRPLEKKDAFYMLEWMHDEDVIKNLSSSFANKTIEDCEAFIDNSVCDKKNLHLAIVSDEDEYMGTVSLKRIDTKRRTAEFAIAMRKCAMGKGYSWYGMTELLKLAFNQKNFESVYWCVSKLNIRACRFYDKHHFNEFIDVPEYILKNYENVNKLKWYIVNKNDDYVGNDRIEILGNKIINIKTIGTPNAGQLSFFETNKDILFEIKRVYYISKVPEGVRRGFHAHKNLKQILFCPYGKIHLVLDDGTNRDEILLDNPSLGVIIDKPMWREMVWVEKDSVLCVGASDYYKADDYIRDYNEFKNYLQASK